MMRTRPHRQFLLSLLIVSCLMLSVACACQVPVFRYALERWSADDYEVVVLHDGGLPTREANELSAWKRAINSPEKPANVRIREIDVGASAPRPWRQLWETHGQADRPLMAVLYPENAQEVPDRLVGVWPFSPTSLKHLIDSPVRQAITERLLAGDSAVWIFVPCGDKQKDQAARTKLEVESKTAMKMLKLPTAEEMETDELVIQEAKIKLKIDFSIVTLERDDPNEEFLLDMLFDSESDLRSFDEEPLAFPVFGRGRVLYALIGKGIASHTIGSACSFMAGPCSCQVKAQNPGFDLLMSVDWDTAVGEHKISSPLPASSAAPVLLTIPPGRSDR